MKPNVVRMPHPGPREIPKPGPDAALIAQIGNLQAQLQQKDMMIEQMRRAIEQNQRVFAEMKGQGQNLAVHLAALLNAKHGGCVWIEPAALEKFGILMDRSEFGGFDFDTIGPDAVGPRRHKMAYMTQAEMVAVQKDQIAMAAANAHGIPAAPPAAIEEPAPEPCSGPWHKSLNAPGDACKKCGLSFPRARE
jgi:hypothetical protein